MKLFAPEYYKDFVCIADRCKHSCCVGWEIPVDDESAERYEALTEGYGDFVRRSLDENEDGRCFSMMPDGRCVHLDGRGLCKMITSLGEDMLCDICREHPRFYNITPRGAEVGIGASCEEAARLILDSDCFDTIDLVGEYDADGCDYLDPCEIRGKIYRILNDTALPYSERLASVYETACVSPAMLTDEDWRTEIEELELMEDDSADRFSVYTSDPRVSEEYGEVLSRFLAYLVYRHATECETVSERRLALGFAFFAERLFASMLKSEGFEARYDIARIISEEIEYSEDNTESIKLEFI